MGNENRTVHYQSLLSGTDHPLAPVNDLCECCIQRIDKIINSKGGNIKGLIEA